MKSNTTRSIATPALTSEAIAEIKDRFQWLAVKAQSMGCPFLFVMDIPSKGQPTLTASDGLHDAGVREFFTVMITAHFAKLDEGAKPDPLSPRALKNDIG